ncbi:MAG: hypothetical protein DWH91_12565 [Planctomycetota bacterium]|nr:MAG: hypothetical protein DWH91_12565 [Planctomycetota bacterium]
MRQSSVTGQDGDSLQTTPGLHRQVPGHPIVSHSVTYSGVNDTNRELHGSGSKGFCLLRSGFGNNDQGID